MSRPKKWASESERKRAARQSGRNPDAPTVNPDVSAANPDAVEPNPDAGPVNPDAKTDAPANPDAPIRTEQWRLDAKAYLATGKLPKVVVPTPGFVAFRDCPDVPHDPKAPPWLGAGRGVVREHKGKRYVLVARHRGNVDLDALEHGVVTAQDFAARLDQRCEHKRIGWACHAC